MNWKGEATMKNGAQHKIVKQQRENNIWGDVNVE